MSTLNTRLQLPSSLLLASLFLSILLHHLFRCTQRSWNWSAKEYLDEWWCIEMQFLIWSICDASSQFIRSLSSFSNGSLWAAIYSFISANSRRRGEESFFNEKSSQDGKEAYSVMSKHFRFRAYLCIKRQISEWRRFISIWRQYFVYLLFIL